MTQLALAGRSIALTVFNLRTHSRAQAAGSARPRVGIAGVVAVLVGVLSIAAGFPAAMTASGSPDVAIVLRSGADSEMTSGPVREETRASSPTRPAWPAPADGPLASAELFVIINLPKRSTGTDANVPLRGVGRRARSTVRGDVADRRGPHVRAGPERGHRRRRRGQGSSPGWTSGSKLRVGQNEWTVVGIFSAGGGAAESEIWTDAAVLQAAYQRGDTFQSVYVQARLARSVPAVQGRADHRPAAQGEGRCAQTELLRRAIHACSPAHHRPRHLHRRA